MLDGIAKGFTAVNIRKFVARAHDLEALVDLGTLDAATARFLRGSVVAGLNVVVSGATQAGKPTNCQYTCYLPIALVDPPPFAGRTRLASGVTTDPCSRVGLESP